MKEVFVLQHSYQLEGCDEDKLIGVYLSEASAGTAIQRLKSKPGFRDYPDNFHIDSYTVGEDNWSEGFCSLVTVYMPLLGDGPGAWSPVQASIRSDGLYVIWTHNDDPDSEIWAFATNDVVRCEERAVSGSESGLVIVEVVEKAV